MSDEKPQAESAPASADAGDSRKKKRLTTGIAFGIGSAAIVAALLYASRSRKSDRGR